MIRISCIFLKSFFSVCSFTSQCDLIFQVHNAPFGHYTDVRNVDFACYDYCNNKV